MGTEVTCSEERCKYNFDNHCTRGEISIKPDIGHIAQISPYPMCMTFFNAPESHDKNEFKMIR